MLVLGVMKSKHQACRDCHTDLPSRLLRQDANAWRKAKFGGRDAYRDLSATMAETPTRTIHNRQGILVGALAEAKQLELAGPATIRPNLLTTALTPSSFHLMRDISRFDAAISDLEAMRRLISVRVSRLRPL